MVVPSISFFLFALLAALAFNVGPAGTWRRSVLLVANVLFLLSFATTPLAWLPFALFLLFGFAGLRLIQSGTKAVFVYWLLATLVLFTWLKRYTFFPEASLLHFPYLVVGLSYVCFRVLHLLIDASSDALPARVELLSYLNYTLNFTSLVAGPIQRYQDYHATESHPAPLNVGVAGEAVERIALGWFKVAVVATLVFAVQHEAIDALASPLPLVRRSLTAMVVVGAYPLFLYANFSGYCDVVIGVARFFRLVLPENFNHPFASFSFIEFWSRWHITLSTWLKTYVYNPLLLAGMRRLPTRKAERPLGVFAFFVTFFLVGVWHGQTSEFVTFGVLQGGGVALNKVYQLKMTDWLGRKPYRELSGRTWYGVLARGLTFSWFGFTLLWFWSDWGGIGELASRTGWGASVLSMIELFALATIGLALTGRLQEAVPPRAGASRYARVALVTLMLGAVVTTGVLVNLAVPNIVYKSF